MIQIVRQTWQERYDMYMQHTKEELASMLAEQAKYVSPDSCKEFEKEVETTMTSTSTSTIKNRCRNHGTHGLHPATKEQRDLLFQKMKESGYEWDAEKKELKKIEQQSAEWSEEDKAFLTVAIAVCNKYSHKDIAGWLKSLKPQPHWKPSEEQMKALYSALNDAISLYSDKVSPLYEKISRTHFNALESLYDDLKKL